ncbi:ATP-binding protein [Corallococcus aberystwythensis]|uniref:ATP-binding protein n=1 Tax=Corallococcus aberystwythensis TaxID=2316722 RepID=UPI0011C377D4|nr:ATP-binding protein [Corallococcus aberystwythensis]
MNDENPSQDTLEIQRRYFETTVPWARQLSERIASEDAELTHIRKVTDYLFHLRIRLPNTIQEGFGTAPEVLIVAVRGQIMARDLERARVELYRSGFRLDLDLIIVCDDSPDLEGRIERLPGKWGQVIPWPPLGQEVPSLQEQFQRLLPKFDLFEEKTPVRGRQVIGRAEEIADLCTRIESGDAIGVFGLRKVGKTSVVRAATDSLDPISARLSLIQGSEHAPGGDNARAFVAWFDVQRAFDRTQKRLFYGLAESIENRLRASKISFKPNANASPLDRIDELVRFSLRNLEIPICIVLDEYDYLFEGSGGQPPIPGVGELFRLLRGWAQETKRLSIVLIGREPAFAQRPELTGFPNPLLGWLVIRWIGPIKPEKAPELLRKLGKRVGLDVGAKTASLAAEWTGGHPLLHRQFGSALLQVTKDNLPHSERITTDAICDRAPAVFQERATVHEVCAEILHLLRTKYTKSYKLLEDATLSNTISASIEKNGGWSGTPALTLRNFGILQEGLSGPFIPEVLLQYAKAFEPQREAPTIATVRKDSTAPSTGDGRFTFPPLSKLLDKAPSNPQPKLPPRHHHHRRRK